MGRSRILRIAIIAAAILLSPPAAAEEPPCRAHPNGTALDFWLGEWRVTSIDGETIFGENRVESALDGCAIFEIGQARPAARASLCSTSTPAPAIGSRFG